MESILTSIKKMLGPTEEYEHFDPDIIIYINTAIMDLTQVGVGPAEGFSISDKNDTWEDFVPELIQNKVKIEAIKSYIYFSVKIAFDPPLNASVLSSMERQMEKLLWRLNVAVDPDTET